MGVPLDPEAYDNGSVAAFERRVAESRKISKNSTQWQFLGIVT